MSDSRTSWSACIISATRAARRSLSPKRISVGGHRVVLVDHRDAAEAEQRVQRGARVEVAAAVLGVVQRQQQLRGGQALGGERLAPGLGQADLADRGGGLLFLQAQPTLVQAKRAARQRDGAGGHHDHVGAAGAERGDVGGHALEPGGAGRGLVRVDHQRAADLHHQALGRGRRDGGRGCTQYSPSPCGRGLGGGGCRICAPSPQPPPARGGGDLWPHAASPAWLRRSCDCSARSTSGTPCAGRAREQHDRPP